MRSGFVLPGLAPIPRPEEPKTILSAYAAGREAGKSAVANPVDILIRNTDANGKLNEAAVRRELHSAMRSVGKRRNDIEREEKKLSAMHSALSRMIEIARHASFAPHEKPIKALYMRSKLKAEFFIALGGSNGTPPPIREYREAMWFDFRKLPVKSDGEMVEFGRELVEEGIVRLPFPTTVFAFPHISPTGEEIAALILAEQNDRKIALRSMMFFGIGKPVAIYGGDHTPSPSIYYALAVLSSKASATARKSVETEEDVDDFYRGDSYMEVVLRLPVNGTRDVRGGHASPRLHWRRGHIRRLGDRTTWVRASLVGKSENGVIVHDYCA